MKNLFLLATALFFLAGCTPQETEAVAAEELTALNQKIDSLNQITTYMPGLIHNVFFWLKEDLTAEEKAAFLEGVKSLGTINTVKAIYIGPPAPTEARDVVDNSFSYALLVHFDNVEGQNAYQIDPIHLKFVEDHEDKWTRVKVYDNTLVD
jgi:hypothetical protein